MRVCESVNEISVTGRLDRGPVRSPAGIDRRSRHRFLQTVYDQYWPELCRYLASRFGEGPPDPQDVVQQAFTQLAAMDKPEKVENPRAFLYRAAINTAIDHKRRTQRRSRILRTEYPAAQEEFSDDLGPERVLLGKDELRVLERAILALPERERVFFLLNRLDGLSFAEIARRTGRSESGVRLIVERALAKCQSALRKSERRWGR